jgi:hypothetical protein
MPDTLEEKAEKTTKPDPMTAYLKEYESLRAEQMKRFELQHQAFNYLLIVLGVVISIVAASLKLTPADNSSAFQTIDLNLLIVIVLWILLFLPLITAPLGFIFFDNEMAIHSIGSHLNWRLKPKVIELIKSNHLLEKVIADLRNENQLDFKQAAVTEENLIFGTSLDFFYLHEKSEAFHRMLSSGKWILFLLPTVGPVILLGLYTLNRKEWWWREFSGDGLLLVYLGIIIYVLDVLVCIILLAAVLWTFIKYRSIKRFE